MLDNHFDAYRFCYNLCLEYKSLMWKQYQINKNGYDMQSELFQIMKDTQWMSKCKVECIREAAHSVEKAFQFFFKGKGYPKFKSKKRQNAFTAYQSIKSIDGKLKFFRNRIKYRDSDKYIKLLENNKIKQVTFKKDSTGDYWATCLIELPNEFLPYNDSSIGIDMGIKDLLITSDGVKYANNKYFKKAQLKLTKPQRKVSKTQNGSNNRKKLRLKIAKLYRKSIRQKEFYYHKITNQLISDNQTILLEDLQITNMVKNHKLAKSINDASWGLIINQIEYKAKWRGREIIRVDAFYPSTKTCSNCGKIKDMPLSERIYNCECGLSLDRDINAAINIRNSGLKIPGESVESVGYELNEAESKSLILTI